VSSYEPVFVFLLQKQRAVRQNEETQLLMSKLDTTRKRIGDLDRLIQKVYEDSILGKISEDRYKKMMQSFEEEQNELIQFVGTYEKKQAEIEKEAVSLRKVLDMLRSCQEIKELTPAIVNTLIERIEVGDDNLKKKGKTVMIDIYYTAIGTLKIPSEEEMEELIKEMR
jgi:hypothetical protein